MADDHYLFLYKEKVKRITKIPFANRNGSGIFYALAKYPNTSKHKEAVLVESKAFPTLTMYIHFTKEC